ncbi:MAG: ribosome biogenesis GTP-binding protein YihA/YsxC [Bacteroidales bacterium]|nr:ribosome biogenesis GTP-binding protein YihA/YsxC [Bacteroidales bacterium]MCL2132954.1 ribosome biogenesis GTP-binding protein YihA/YsxC [Bacteroidales bacterium]
MIIKSASFVCSSAKVEQCPKQQLSEFAFIGRSNVGKSSLINRLTDHGGLAKTSSTPGKTQLINHFIINNNWYLVDLPGYGYAKASKTSRRKFSNIITEYISHREQLTLLFVLIDARLEPQAIDLEFINKLGEDGIPFALAFTKADKLGTGALSSNVAHYKKVLLESWEELPPVFITSAQNGQGKEDVLKYIENVINSLL